jgi:hypothetical protein
VTWLAIGGSGISTSRLETFTLLCDTGFGDTSAKSNNCARVDLVFQMVSGRSIVAALGR